MIILQYRYLLIYRDALQVEPTHTDYDNRNLKKLVSAVGCKNIHGTH